MFCEEQGLQLRMNIAQNLDEAFGKLNAGEGTVIAYHLTITKNRKKRIVFTHFHPLQKQVLIQRKPEG